MAKFKITASKASVSEPLISTTIYKTGAQFNISKARVGEWGKELIVDIVGSGEQIKKALKSLEKSGAKVNKFKESIVIDHDLCVDCGACVTLCAWYAIEFKKDWGVAHIPDKCVGCLLCVPCCPVEAIKTIETVE